jgi:hypothetical protein
MSDCWAKIAVRPCNMARVLRFHTAVFGVTKERPNPVNPIAGESLLLWLIEQGNGAVEISTPAAEDWGWYSYAEWKGRKYLLGASTCDEEEDGQREWVLQIDKQRSVKEKLQGRTKMSHDDECAQYFQGLLERNFRYVSIELEL